MKKVIIGIVSGFALFSSCNSSLQLEQGDRLGNGMLLSIDHQRYYLNQNKEQVQVLVFWATWCTICKKELMEFETYKNQLQNDKLNIAAVCFNPEEIDKVKNIVDHLKINYPILLDEGAQLYNRFQTNAAPLTVIIDSKGYIDLIIEGYNNQIMRKITSRIEVLLENHE